MKRGSMAPLMGRKARIVASLLLTSVFACFATPSHAVDLTHVMEGYILTSWSARNGLPTEAGLQSGSIWAIAQDTNGYMWLGTNDGLIRFDGDRFIEWAAFGSRTGGARSVRSLHVSRDGALWIGF